MTQTGDPDFISTDSAWNARDFLNRALPFILEARDNPEAWKWVILTLDGALYGYAVTVAAGTDATKVVKATKEAGKVREKLWEAILEEAGSETSQDLTKVGELLGRLLDMNIGSLQEVLRMVQEPHRYEDLEKGRDPDAADVESERLKRHPEDAFQRDHGYWEGVLDRPFRMTKSEFDSVNKLHEIRNKFIHFMPGGYSLGVSGLPALARDVLGVIRSLLEASIYVDLDPDTDHRISKCQTALMELEPN